ncbi:CBO0543 family protein [Paenibacillus hamazuiensis]|uniref:CBO0543 family protein n=1 Tax=Paenibacillus hamazuiensis TaxID=2936508 RepID=UPI00200FC713|nr:CBO0543 family protein [Paenibacillus hamazuiensis]
MERYLLMSNEQLHEMQQNNAFFEVQRWLNNSIFTWTWWFVLGILVIPWCIAVILIDRKRAHSIWFFGLVVLIITSFIDDLGAEIGIWVYPVKLLPYSLIAFPFDFSIIPVAQMLIFQYFSTWKTFFLALVLQAITFAFIGEPFSVWIEAIAYYGWNYFYSFLFYIFTGTFSRAFVNYWTPKA